MSLALQALGGEVRARGSMLRDAATAWLSRRHGVSSASKAHAMVEQGAGLGYFRLDDGSLYPAERENPACPCKAKTHAAVAAVPTRLADKVAPRENLAKLKACPTPKVPKGKLSAASRAKLPTCAFADPKGERFPIHDVGHAKAAIPRLAAEFKRGNVSTAEYKRFHKRIQDALIGYGIKVSGQLPAGEKQNPASNTQETTPMAKARKAKKAKTARKAPKKRRTAAQKAATKKMLAANKARSKPAKARKARKPRTWAQAAKQGRAKARRKASPRKRAASRRRLAPGTTQIVTVAGPKPASRRRAGTRRRRAVAAAPARRHKATRKRAETRRSPRQTRVVRTSTTTTSFRNPMGKNGGTVKMMAVGMVSGAIGFGAAELIDRLIVTRAGQDTAGTAKRITGYGAILVRSNVPDMYRMGAAGGGTLVLGAATWAVSKYTRSDVGTAILGGMTFGFGLKTLALGVQYLMPYILPVANISEDTWQNQLFPENFFASDAAKAPTAGQFAEKGQGMVTNQGMSFGGPRRFGQGAVSRQDFGPVAGQTGCGCSRCQGATASPKARAPQAPESRPESAARPGSVVNLPTGSVGAPPSSNVTPIKKGVSMSSLLGIKE